MTIKRKLAPRIPTALLAAAMALALAPAALASSGGDYVLNWYTIDGGGSESSGGDYTVVGTAGQPDAGAHTGGDYAVAGGFWPGAVAAADLTPVQLLQYLLGNIDLSPAERLAADANSDGQIDIADYIELQSMAP